MNRSQGKEGLAGQIEYVRRLRKQEISRAASVEAFLERLIEELRTRLSSGEEVCDPITAYFLRERGIIDESVIAPVKELEERMAGKTGQLCTVVQTAVTCSVGPGDCAVYSTSERITVGILGGEKIVFEEEKMLPVRRKRRVLYGIPFSQRINLWETLKCVSGGNAYYLFPYASGVHKPNVVTAGVLPMTEFRAYVGDEDVSVAWPSICGRYEAEMAHAIRMLGKKLLPER